jgi:hypothetical protein
MAIIRSEDQTGHCAALRRNFSGVAFVRRLANHKTRHSTLNFASMTSELIRFLVAASGRIERFLFAVDPSN